MDIDALLERADLKYEDLNAIERKTFNDMVEKVSKTEINNETLKEYISTMKESVERELADEPEHVRVWIFAFRNDKNILLKARIRNYMLLEAFLESPKKAKEALDRAIAGMVPKK